MRKFLVLLPAIIIAFMFASCGDDSTTNPVGTTGGIFVQSTPPGAQIWLEGTNTNKFTPDTVTNLDEGSHNITLKLSEYRDTTVSVQVTADQTTSRSVTLVSSLTLVSFGSVRIYETAGTDTTQPSGLDLSTGNAYGISSSNNDKVDIYYSTDGTGGVGFLVQSANLSPSMSRVTKFRVGSGADLDDGVNSPFQNSGTWANFMNDRETNYVFLYDNDGNYSKAKITNWGGVAPAWVEITWYYNRTSDTPNF